MTQESKSVFNEGFAKVAKAFEEGRFGGSHIDALLEDPDYILPCDGWEETLVRRMGPERWSLIGCAAGQPVIARENRGHSNGYGVEWAGSRLEGVRDFRDYSVVDGRPQFTAREHLSGPPGGESGDYLFVHGVEVVARIGRSVATEVAWFRGKPVARTRDGKVVFTDGAWTALVEPKVPAGVATDSPRPIVAEGKPLYITRDWVGVAKEERVVWGDERGKAYAAIADLGFDGGLPVYLAHAGKGRVFLVRGLHGDEETELKPVDENGRPVTLGRVSAEETVSVRWPAMIGKRLWYVLSSHRDYGGGGTRQVESLARDDSLAPRDFGKPRFKPDFTRVRRPVDAGGEPLYIGVYGRPWDRAPGEMIATRERFHLVHGLVMSKGYDEDLCSEVIGDTIVGYGSRGNRIYRVSRRVL